MKSVLTCTLCHYEPNTTWKDKTDLKQGRYRWNKIQGPICNYQNISGASKQESRDTTNSAHE
jgi:hypothetical protein